MRGLRDAGTSTGSSRQLPIACGALDGGPGNAGPVGVSRQLPSPKAVDGGQGNAGTSTGWSPQLPLACTALVGGPGSAKSSVCLSRQPLAREAVTEGPGGSNRSTGWSRQLPVGALVAACRGWEVVACPALLTGGGGRASSPLAAHPSSRTRFRPPPLPSPRVHPTTVSSPLSSPRAHPCPGAAPPLGRATAHDPSTPTAPVAPPASSTTAVSSTSAPTAETPACSISCLLHFLCLAFFFLCACSPCDPSSAPTAATGTCPLGPAPPCTGPSSCLAAGAESEDSTISNHSSVSKDRNNKW